MFRMDNTLIIQTTEKVIAEVQAIAYDLRTQKRVNLVIYCELTENNQDVKPIIEHVLERMGYQYMGIGDVITTSVPFDALEMYETGIEKEKEDLNRK